MRFVMVFHGPKAEELSGPVEVRVNPPLTIAGMNKIFSLVPAVRQHAPFAGFYSSRLARALDTASILALELNQDFATSGLLGQYANKDGNDVIFYPGSEKEGFVEWQQSGLNAVAKLWHRHKDADPNGTILVVSHRPIIGGIIAAIQGVKDKDAINKIVNDPSIAEKGFAVIETDDGANLRLA
jgi:broad specificity phosphatase PhoE